MGQALEEAGEGRDLSAQEVDGIGEARRVEREKCVVDIGKVSGARAVAGIDAREPIAKGRALREHAVVGEEA